jgi:hypothetical protein
MFSEGELCAMHAQQARNVQDARGKLAQEFAHEGDNTRESFQVRSRQGRNQKAGRQWSNQILGTLLLKESCATLEAISLFVSETRSG